MGTHQECLAKAVLISTHNILAKPWPQGSNEGGMVTSRVQP